MTAPVVSKIGCRARHTSATVERRPASATGAPGTMSDGRWTCAASRVQDWPSAPRVTPGNAARWTRIAPLRKLVQTCLGDRRPIIFPS